MQLLHLNTIDVGSVKLDRNGASLQHWTKTTTGFRVWIRPLADACRLRVDGMQNARWLLTQLSRSFLFKSAKPIDDDEGPSSCVFHIRYSSQVSHHTLEKALAAISNVELISDPA